MRGFLFGLLFLLACNPQLPIAQLTPAPTGSPVTRADASVAIPTAEHTAFLSFGDKLHLVDLTTGKDASDFPPIDTFATPNFSPDGKTVVLYDSGTQVCEPGDGGMWCHREATGLIFINTATHRQIKMALPGGGWLGATVPFRSDSEYLALSYIQHETSTLMIINVQAGKLVMQRTVDFRPSFLNFAPDGNSLVVYAPALEDDTRTTPPPPPHVMLLDATTLQDQWDQILTDVVHGSWCIGVCVPVNGELASQVRYPAIVPSQDGGQLYIVHAGVEQLTTVDLRARTVQTTKIEMAQGPIEKFLAFFATSVQAKGNDTGSYISAVLSSDGKSLYVGSQDLQAGDYTIGTLERVEISSRHILSKYAVANQPDVSDYFYEMNLLADGAHLYFVRGDSASHWETTVMDVSRWLPVANLDNWRLLIAHGVNGTPILLAHQPGSGPAQLGIVDPTTFHISRTFSLDTNDGWIQP